MFHFTSRLLPALLATAHVCAGAPGQKPLTSFNEGSNDRFSVRKQSAELCDAGSSFWTGSVQVTPEKSMFFWYFESRHDPENDPVMLWMSGGPGATGEFGIFKDSGPCAVNDDGNSTFKRPYAWNDRANVIYIDQPIGIGFSDITDRDLMSTNLHDGAQDLYAFLSIFTEDIFPETVTKKWHITGESMGGHYVTAYTHYIIQQQRERAIQGQDLKINIDGVIIVDGFVEMGATQTGLYDFLCLDWLSTGAAPLLEASKCEAMGAGIPECEKKAALCVETYDIEVCEMAATHCNDTMAHFFWEGVKPGGWNPYDARLKCTEPPLCSNMQEGPTLKFLNQDWVQEKLGVPHRSFSLIDMDCNNRWTVDGSMFRPTTRELSWILDETDVRVLFINGNEDMIINSPGQHRMLNELPWSGMANFRQMTLSDWYFSSGEVVEDVAGSSHSTKGGQFKGNQKLGLALIDNAGHMAPWDNAEAVSSAVRAWIK